MERTGRTHRNNKKKSKRNMASYIPILHVYYMFRAIFHRSQDYGTHDEDILNHR